MKKIAWLIQALLLVAAVALAGCNIDVPAEEDNGGPTSCWLGKTFTLSGQVWTTEYNNLLERDIEVPHPYLGNETLGVTSNNGDSGSIVNGKLNITIDTPASNLQNLNGVYQFGFQNREFMWVNDQIDDYDVKCVILSLSCSSFGDLKKGKELSSSSGSTEERVLFIYVNSDVTYTANGIYRFVQPGEGYGLETSNDVHILLKEGWNAIYYTEKTVHGPGPDNISVRLTAQNPASAKWYY